MKGVTEIASKNPIIAIGAAACVVAFGIWKKDSLLFKGWWGTAEIQQGNKQSIGKIDIKKGRAIIRQTGPGGSNQTIGDIVGDNLDLQLTQNDNSYSRSGQTTNLSLPIQNKPDDEAVTETHDGEQRTTQGMSMQPSFT